MAANRYRELLEQTLPYVTDPRLVAEVALALGQQGRKRAAAMQALPVWMRELDGAQLMLLTDAQLRGRGLEDRDPTNVLSEVRRRIDEAGAAKDRVPYPVETWVAGQVQQRPRLRPERAIPQRARRKAKAPPPRLTAFANQVAQLFQLPAGFAALLARAIAEHDPQTDPVAQASLSRIADGFVAHERDAGDLMGVTGQDGRYLTYLDMGGPSQGTIIYDTLDLTFSLNTPANAARGVAMPQLTVAC